MIAYLHKELTEDDIAEIARTYHAWRGEKKDGTYEDVPGFCKAATLEDIRKNDYVLTPGRYVGAAEIEDDGVVFEERMGCLSAKFACQVETGRQLDSRIMSNLRTLGYV